MYHFCNNTALESAIAAFPGEQGSFVDECDLTSWSDEDAEAHLSALHSLAEHEPAATESLQTHSMVASWYYEEAVISSSLGPYSPGFAATSPTYLPTVPVANSPKLVPWEDTETSSESASEEEVYEAPSAVHRGYLFLGRTSPPLRPSHEHQRSEDAVSAQSDFRHQILSNLWLHVSIA